MSLYDLFSIACGGGGDDGGGGESTRLTDELLFFLSSFLSWRILVKSLSSA